MIQHPAQQLEGGSEGFLNLQPPFQSTGKGLVQVNAEHNAMSNAGLFSSSTDVQVSF